MPTEPAPDAAVYAAVCDVLIGTKFLLEAMQTARTQGHQTPEEDAATVAGLIPRLAEVATLFHAWYATHHEVPQGGAPYLTLPSLDDPALARGAALRQDMQALRTLTAMLLLPEVRTALHVEAHTQALLYVMQQALVIQNASIEWQNTVL